ncbi:MAG: sel1 repeat family protein [Haliea sp.]|nr:MAG: sel1 repeat family protein [Haliea sp.]
MSEPSPLSLVSEPIVVTPAGRVCPRCSYQRRPTDAAPAWQCPRCEVAYDKATRSSTVEDRAARREQERARQQQRAARSRTLAWACLALAVVAAAAWGFQRWRAANPTAQEKALAAQAQARQGEVAAALAGQDVLAELKLAGEHLNMARTEQGLAILERHAAQNHPRAMVQLAIVYRDGYRVPQDLPRAMEWLRKAAGEGYAPAFVNLGLASETGKGKPQSWDEAVNQYTKAARQGDPTGLYSLGLVHARGAPGYPPNPLLAHFLLDLADRGGRGTTEADSQAPHDRTAFWAAGELRRLAEKMSPADVARSRAWADEWKPGQPWPDG